MGPLEDVARACLFLDVFRAFESHWPLLDPTQVYVRKMLDFLIFVLCRTWVLRHLTGFNAFWYSHMLLLLMFPLLIFHGSRRPIGQYPTTSVSFRNDGTT